MVHALSVRQKHNRLCVLSCSTRTCYRTCHTNDPVTGEAETCQATLTGVHNQNIPTVPAGPNSTLQVLFSPNYNDGKDYRKSTVCRSVPPWSLLELMNMIMAYRYDVTCPEGQILSYLFVDHVLENRTNSCIVDNKCVDYVELSFPNTTVELKTCGEEAEVNTLFADGYSGLDVEFYTNRHEQALGFALNVFCSEPGTPQAKRKREIREEEEKCTQAADDAERPTMDTAKELVSYPPLLDECGCHKLK